MKRTGFLYDNRYLLHETGPYHPEIPERLKAVFKGVEAAGLLPKLTLISASLPDMKWIYAVHDRAYVDRFNDACVAGRRIFDSQDNQMGTDTFDTAQLAVGGILEAVKMVMEDRLDNAFCAVRPPGHHAEHDKALGFCYFNNVAIAARYLQMEWGIERVGIIDFDVHHGNGTQAIFEEDPTVFYYSIHQHPSFAFPGTGREFEKGTGKGAGFTCNSPVLPGKGDEEYHHLIKRDLLPAFDTFRPEVILVSAGFDAHDDDDMSDMRLSTQCFSWIMERIMEMGNQYCQGRVISILEGGYCLERLPELLCNHIEILLRG